MNIAVVGAGILGRLVAWRALKQGAQITIFDPDPSAKSSCSWVGAGMLSPISELELAEPIIAELGIASMELYKQWIPDLEQEIYLNFNGTLVVHHQQDRADCQKFLQRLTQKLTTRFVSWAPQEVDVGKLEPQLAEKFSRAYFIPGEGQIHARALLNALENQLSDVAWKKELIDPKQLAGNHFDWIIDCRGLRANLPMLRGVRGELIHLHNPHFQLKRAVRIMHPRYPIYLVPRPNQQFIVGATSIESHDMEPIQVISMLELLSAAFSVHPTFAEAHVIEQCVQCRPAFSHNLPKIQVCGNTISANGLYRHGYLIAPAMAADIVKYMAEVSNKPDFEQIWSTEH